MVKTLYTVGILHMVYVLPLAWIWPFESTVVYVPRGLTTATKLLNGIAAVTFAVVFPTFTALKVHWGCYVSSCDIHATRFQTCNHHDATVYHTSQYTTSALTCVDRLFYIVLGVTAGLVVLAAFLRYRCYRYLANNVHALLLPHASSVKSINAYTRLLAEAALRPVRASMPTPHMHSICVIIGLDPVSCLASMPWLLERVWPVAAIQSATSVACIVLFAIGGHVRVALTLLAVAYVFNICGAIIVSYNSYNQLRAGSLAIDQNKDINLDTVTQALTHPLQSCSVCSKPVGDDAVTPHCTHKIHLKCIDARVRANRHRCALCNALITHYQMAG